MMPIDHRERRAPLLSVMDNRLGLEVANHAADEIVIGQVADREFNSIAGKLAPRGDALLEREDRNQAVGAAFEVPQAPIEVVDHADSVAPFREIHRLRPTEISIPTRYNHPHRKTPPADILIPDKLWPTERPRLENCHRR